MTLARIHSPDANFHSLIYPYDGISYWNGYGQRFSIIAVPINALGQSDRRLRGNRHD